MESELDKVIAMNNLEATHRDMWESKGKNRELHELLGLWRKDGTNPDYAAHPWLVLKEMRNRTDWPKYEKSLPALYHNRFSRMDVLLDYILSTAGELRDQTIEWLRKEAYDASNPA